MSTLTLTIDDHDYNCPKPSILGRVCVYTTEDNVCLEVYGLSTHSVLNVNHTRYTSKTAYSVRIPKKEYVWIYTTPESDWQYRIRDNKTCFVWSTYIQFLILYNGQGRVFMKNDQPFPLCRMRTYQGEDYDVYKDGHLINVDHKWTQIEKHTQFDRVYVSAHGLMSPLTKPLILEMESCVESPCSHWGTEEPHYSRMFQSLVSSRSDLVVVISDNPILSKLIQNYYNADYNVMLYEETYQIIDLHPTSELFTPKYTVGTSHIQYFMEPAMLGTYPERTKYIMHTLLRNYKQQKKIISVRKMYFDALDRYISPHARVFVHNDTALALKLQTRFSTVQSVHFNDIPKEIRLCTTGNAGPVYEQSFKEHHVQIQVCYLYTRCPESALPIGCNGYMTDESLVKGVSTRVKWLEHGCVYGVSLSNSSIAPVVCVVKVQHNMLTHMSGNMNILHNLGAYSTIYFITKSWYFSLLEI